jgi:hypothetical protein
VSILYKYCYNNNNNYYYFKGFSVKNCKGFENHRNEFVLDGSGSSQSGICRGVVKTEDGSPGQPYRLVVEMYSYSIGSPGGMHPGIGFNVQDEDNFDYVYFR